MELFPKRIRSVRKHLKMTQENLAKQANTTIANVSCYEKGHQKPSLDMLVRLCEALDCSTDYLLGRSDQLKIKKDNKHEVIVLKERNNYTFLLDDGSPLSSDEVEEMIEYVQFKRKMKQKKLQKI